MMWTEADVQRLKERVRRAATAVHRPFVATGTGDGFDLKVPNIGPIMEANYRRLVARGAKQGWVKQDEESLRAKVRRLYRG